MTKFGYLTQIAFLVGLICPHDGGFARQVTDKIEDIVAVLLLPLYFALSGLSTNLGLLNDGITWAYVIGVIAVAFSAKIIGATLAARACKLLWRESFSIGVLMSCKGLVELIVLVSVLRSATLCLPFTDQTEYRSASQDSLDKDFYYFRGHGIGHNSLYYSLDHRFVPSLVSEKA